MLVRVSPKFLSTSRSWLYATIGVIVMQLCLPQWGGGAQAADKTRPDVFRPAERDLVQFNWKEFIANQLQTTERVYSEHVERMNGESLYPGVSRIKIPVYVPTKEGIAELLRKTDGGEDQNKLTWEFCAEADLPKVWPIYNNANETSYAFSYAVTGRIRADSTTSDSNNKRISFSYILLGTAVRKGIPDAPTPLGAEIKGLISDEQLGFKIVSFQRNSLAFVLITSNFKCLSRTDEQKCSAIEDSFLELFIKSLKIVGGLRPTEGELSNMENFLQVGQGDEGIPFSQGSGRAQDFGVLAGTPLRYFRPGKLFESGRKGVEDFNVYERNLGAAGQSLYALKDHRELKAIVGAGKPTEYFHESPWRDTFCAGGIHQDDRCKEGLGALWQDLFSPNCIVIPWNQIFGNQRIFPFLSIVVSPTPYGGALIGSRAKVVEAQCNYTKIMMLVNLRSPHGFTIVPSYSSFVWSEIQH